VTSEAAGAPSVQQSATGAISVTSAAAGAPSVQQSATGTISVTSVVEGAPTSVHLTSGSVDVITEAFGSPTVQGAAGVYSAFGEVEVISAASGSAVVLHAATGTVPVVTTASDAAIAAHPATGTAEVVTDAAGTPASVQMAMGTAAVTTSAAGAPTSAQLATGTVAVVTDAIGAPIVTTSQQHTATGTVSVITSVMGAPTSSGATNMTPFVLVLGTLERVLEVLTTPEVSGGCPLDIEPCRISLYPGGEVAFDACGDSCSGGEGQLWANLQPSSISIDSATGKCQVIRYTAEIGITRCAAPMGKNGEPPSVDAVAADAWKQALDADQILSAITCCDALNLNERDKLIPVSWRPVDNQGGCVGGIWTINGALSMCCD
jgi:hypothetical protein